MKTVILFLTLASTVFSAEITTVEKPDYSKNVFGFHIKHMGTPFPNALGFGFSYFISRYLKFELSYAPGDFSNSYSSHSISTGFDARLFSRDIAPTFGIHWATVINGKDPNFGGIGKNLFFKTAISWNVAKFFAAVGYNIPLWVGPRGLPFIEVGIFF